METGLHGVIGAGGEQGRGALLGHAGNNAGARAGDLLVHGIPNVAQVSGLETLKLIVRQPLVLTETLGKVDIVCTVAGGGVEILPAEAAAASAGPVLLEDGRMYRVRWGELEVSQSALACTYD